MHPNKFIACSGFAILTFTSSVILAEEETMNEPAQLKEAEINPMKQDWLEKEIALADHRVSYDDEGLLDIGIGKSIDGRRQVKRFPLAKLEFYFESQNHKDSVAITLPQTIQSDGKLHETTSMLEQFYFSRGYRQILFLIEETASPVFHRDVISKHPRQQKQPFVLKDQDVDDRFKQLLWVEEQKANSDHSIFYDSQDSIDINVGAIRENVHHQETFTLSELGDYFLNQRHKAFVVVTFAKGFQAKGLVSAEIPKLESFFFSRGYQRILFLGARAASVAIYKDSILPTK